MKIIRDSREQSPFHFEDTRFDGVEVIEGTLTTGDYSIAGLENRVAVERKKALLTSSAVSAPAENALNGSWPGRGAWMPSWWLSRPLSLRSSPGTTEAAWTPKPRPRRPTASWPATAALFTSRKVGHGPSMRFITSCVTTPDRWNENTRRLWRETARIAGVCVCA